MVPSLAIAKLAANIVAGLSVGKVINDIVTNNVAMITTTQKVLAHTGGFIIGSMVVDQACKHVDKQIDSLLDMGKKMQEEKAEEEKKEDEQLPT